MTAFDGTAPDTQQLIALVRSTTGLQDPIDEGTPLISTGLIDSFDIVSILGALEQEFGVLVQPQDIDVTHFDTVEQMVRFIREEAR